MAKKKERTLLFTVTQADCRMDTFRSGGKGGQHQNKTESGVRFVHPPSGAVGQARDDRSQHVNKKLAWRRMAESKEFVQWAKFQAASEEQVLDDYNRMVRQVGRHNLKVEVMVNGRWEEVND